MISRTPEEREFYESRLKFLRDEEARILFARSEGREEGLQEGYACGQDTTHTATAR